jgi:hypothetical protein
VNTGIIFSAPISDQRFILNLRDYRDGIHITLPTERFSLAEFANLDSNADGKVRAFGFGTITNAIPTCIDTVNRVFEFHNGRCKSVTELTMNGVVLTEDVDYFVDYGLGRFTLARGMSFSNSDILLITFHGATNSADEEISNGAEIFKYAMNEWLDMQNINLNLDSIYATKYEKTTELSLYIWKEMGSQEFIRRIEQSNMAYSYQDNEGRLGLRTQQATAGSDTKYISNVKVMDFGTERNQETLFSSINIHYGEDYSIDQFRLLVKSANTVPILYRVSKALDVYVALASESDANDLGDLILADLNRRPISFSVPLTLYASFPGDLIYFSRDRFPSMSGTANNILLRIISISKQYSSGKTMITAEVV